MALRYEDKADVIDEMLERRRRLWTLTAAAWMDYGDVKQILKKRIFDQWDKWDQNRPFGPWANRVIQRYTINILRDNYYRHARPCLRCPYKANKGGDLCRITPSGKQYSECPDYARWEKQKRAGYEIKFAKPIHPDTPASQSPCAAELADMDYDVAARRMHTKMKSYLTPLQFKIYTYMVVENRGEEEVARLMGYHTTESGRRAGYKQLRNYKKVFLEKAKEILENEDILPPV